MPAIPKKRVPKPVARMEAMLSCAIEKAFDGKGFEGHMLPMSLSAAVPLWMHQFKDLDWEQREHLMKEVQKDDFCLRLEYVLHKGPKEGDSARAFNDLAKAIALLSFCPGGVCVFGTRYQWKQERIPVK